MMTHKLSSCIFLRRLEPEQDHEALYILRSPFHQQLFHVCKQLQSKGQSLSSCESELHSLVSSACDGIYIRACAMFVLNGLVEHIQYTDSSSARQLACRQGCGRVRHVTGKLLWIQEKRQTNPFHFTLLSRFTMWQTLEPKLCHVNDSFTFCIHVV